MISLLDLYCMESFVRALFTSLLQRDSLICENLVMDRNCWEVFMLLRGYEVDFEGAYTWWQLIYLEAIGWLKCTFVFLYYSPE